MPPWWHLLELSSRCLIFKWNHCNAFEDQAPVDFMYKFLIFTRVTENWWHGRVLYVLNIQCKPDISRSCISRNWIYRGRMLDPIFLPTDFVNFAQERDIFHEIAFTPCIQFAGDNFSRNLLTAIAFVPVRWRQFFAKSTLAYLSMRAGTHAVRWAATLGGALTPPLCRRVGSS